MMQCDEPLVTVCLPPWQVKRLVTLCIRSMRKYYLITHSNVIVRREAWLSRMIELLVRNPNCAGYGYDKLKMKSPLRNLARRSLDTKRARLWMRNPCPATAPQHSAMSPNNLVISVPYIALTSCENTL